MQRTLRKVADAAVHIPLTLGAMIMAIPFLWLISTAFKVEKEVVAWPPLLIPREWTLVNFVGVFKAAPFQTYFLNSLLFALASTAGILVTSTVAGYVLAKIKFPGRGALFVSVLATAIVPFEIYMIPLYVTMKDLGLINSFTGIAMPYLVMSFGIFFMRQNILASIPDELLEAARIDGASELRTFLQIVVPLLKGAMSALAIFAFIQGWNAFIWPLLMATDQTNYTMELGLAKFQSAFTINFGLSSAGSVISIAPIIIMFLLLRRHIVDGLALTGLKS
ncbi:MAG TPA: carbohydrate ABC transporter permease [Symbiobacteriaceae bacterium]|nr:carbohydrate ABC transporter permease [Symbiobacteriaceae bacterium]